MKIRPYVDKDYAFILEIYHNSKLDELRFEEKRFELLPLEKDAIRYAKLMESDIYVYDDNGIRGYCAVYGSEIRALYVDPARRGLGIGRRMLMFLLDRIAGPAELSVARSNAPAIGLYQKHGFKIVDEFETRYNGEPVMAVKMARSMDAIR